MKKIKVLEVNNIDLPGKAFNGYNFINDLDKEKFQIKQAVIIKQSTNDKVVKIINDDRLMYLYEKYEQVEDKLSIHNLLSVTSPLLMNMPEYKEADIIHFHMFHNTKLSIPSLINMSREKKIIISLHDPWFLTGRCVHFYNCNKWKNGCENCEYINTLFQFNEDNCSKMWNIKKEVFHNSNIEFFVHSKWLENLAKSSPLIKEKKSIHYISFGVNLEKYKNFNRKDALRKKYKIGKDEIVLFLRAQLEFKGTEYILEALKLLDINKKITVITCDQKGLLNEVCDKYRIIDLGSISEDIVIEVMNLCDIFLMPSKAETFGMMAIEAMACEKPVIAFDNTAMAQTIHAPYCGIVVPDKDANKLMEAIKELSLNDEERLKRGKLGRKICEKHYSYSDYLDKISLEYQKIYQKKLNTKPYLQDFNMDEYEKYLYTIKKIIKEKNYNKFDRDFLFNHNITYLNLANDEIFREINSNKLKVKIPFKIKFRLFLKNSKIIRTIYYYFKY